MPSSIRYSTPGSDDVCRTSGFGDFVGDSICIIGIKSPVVLQ